MTALPWPLPALAAWAACWIVFAACGRAGVGAAAAFAVAGGLGAAFAVAAPTRWRRLFVACGFPLSLALFGVSGAPGDLPAWSWLVPLLLLVLVYPLRAWRDAPLFPTPRGALRGLASELPLPADARVLDAGCGLGDALLGLHREYPKARLAGVEQSTLLRTACAFRCPFATVRGADMWSTDWSPFDLVYVFQRPESMARAAAKAARDLKPEAWLASLEFEIAGCRPARAFACTDGRRLWLYRGAELASFARVGR